MGNRAHTRDPSRGIRRRLTALAEWKRCVDRRVHSGRNGNRYKKHGITPTVRAVEKESQPGVEWEPRERESAERVGSQRWIVDADSAVEKTADANREARHHVAACGVPHNALYPPRSVSDRIHVDAKVT